MAVRSLLVGSSVIVPDEKESNRLFNEGWFGKVDDGKLRLSLVEAFYLMERGKIEVYEGDNELDVESFMTRAKGLSSRFWTKYSIYSDIRKKGYITKTAFKYGADFRVYERGEEPGKEHAKWILYCVRENENFNWKNFAGMMRVAHSVRKDLMIGILDNEGDVTYYTVNWEKP